MPILVYTCPEGHTLKKFSRTAPDKTIKIFCPSCLKQMAHSLRAPNSKSVVVVDNGVQAKAVEVDLNMVEKLREQSEKDFTEKE